MNWVTLRLESKGNMVERGMTSTYALRKCPGGCQNLKMNKNELDKRVPLVPRTWW